MITKLERKKRRAPDGIPWLVQQNDAFR